LSYVGGLKRAEVRGKDRALARLFGFRLSDRCSPI
jgi:hypothetical protein